MRGNNKEIPAVVNQTDTSANMTMHDADYLPSIEVSDPLNDPSPVNIKLTTKLEPGNLPPYRAVFLIANAALGAGLLNFPEAYKKAGGLKTAIIIQLVSRKIYVILSIMFITSYKILENKFLISFFTYLLFYSYLLCLKLF